MRDVSIVEDSIVTFIFTFVFVASITTLAWLFFGMLSFWEYTRVALFVASIMAVICAFYKIITGE